MCQRLCAASYDVHAFDINPEMLAAAVTSGAQEASSAVACAQAADILLTSLPRPDHIEALMAGESGLLAQLRPGSLWVDLTTNNIKLISRLAVEAPDGISVVDSPVTGAVDGARTGKLTLFLGGAPDDRARAIPVLENLGQVIECGDLGNGNVVKLVTNQLWFIASAALGEGFATGIANGVPLDTLWHAIKESVGDSFVARHDAPSIFAGHYDPSFTLDLCLKDLNLIAELNNTVATDLPMTLAAHETFKRAEQRYGPDAAELHVAKRIEDDAGLSMRLEGDWTPHWEK
ncbi:MAG: 3-hydroxyisobutyrate dehydrogenase-like beta-hydroxyacid dehydrogenase [Candidatus Azotimanducaceae bacterium]|jgi:3-hydroxyisobutyrate dehydrogenase-like beta-hydroxyacid dehydrogenase